MTKESTTGRPRSFDEEVALTRVMETFWNTGYSATSYPALERATGLRRQSLIYAFGDKPAMFVRALALYIQRRVSEIVAVLEGKDAPLDRVNRVFEIWIADASHESHRGCLLVNTVGELGRTDQKTAEIISTATERLAQAFEHCFHEAQLSKVLRADVDPADLARLAVAVGDGALLQARAGGTDAQAVRAYTAFLGLLR